jgi:hypothetical protein
MLKNIINRNGKAYLKVSYANWNNYLNIVSPHRNSDKNVMYCAFRDKTKTWCDTCDTGIGSWTNSCVNIISSINLQKYSHMFSDGVKDTDFNFHLVKIDGNDDNGTI